MMLSHLFEPLDLKPEHCLYFYYISVITFIMFTFTTIGFISYLLFKSKRNIELTANLVSLLFSTFISYFSNRLLYTMCVKHIN